MKTVYIGLLGCGNIGSGVTKLLAEMRAEWRENYQVDPVVKAILVRDLSKQRPEYVDTSLLTDDKDRVLMDPEIRYVVECLGGEHPSADWMCEALRAGKHVVTANKMALALHWRELHDASEAGRSSLYFEAAVGGAMPKPSSIVRMSGFLIYGDVLSYYRAASTMAAKSALFKEAPPISPPSTLGFLRRSAAFLAFIEPPYWIIILLAVDLPKSTATQSLIVLQASSA